MELTMPVLSRPPRAVPLSTRLVVLFGGILSTFGWFFFAFGMVFVWIFAGNADWSSAFAFHGQLQTAPGKVTASEETHFTEGGSKHSRGTPIFAHRYTFDSGGTNFTGISYCKGGGARDGAKVTVEFPAGKPECSRIRGMRRAPFGLVVAFVFIFPAAGLAIVLPGLWSGWRNVRLLANGEITRGRLITKEPTNMQVNKQTVYKLTFQFTDKFGNSRQAVAKTPQPERLEDNPFERIFYDPLNPARAVLFDNLPGKQGFTEKGQLQPDGFWAATKVSILPSLALLVVVGGFWLTIVKQ